LTEAATVVGRTLIVALREAVATLDALIVVSLADRRVAAGSQSDGPVLACDRYRAPVLAGSDAVIGMQGRHGYSHEQDEQPGRTYELDAFQLHVDPPVSIFLQVRAMASRHICRTSSLTSGPAAFQQWFSATVRLKERRHTGGRFSSLICQ
jgi:hypothetical protein